jgi:hypothetical protein
VADLERPAERHHENCAIGITDAVLNGLRLHGNTCSHSLACSSRRATHQSRPDRRRAAHVSRQAHRATRGGQGPHFPNVSRLSNLENAEATRKQRPDGTAGSRLDGSVLALSRLSPPSR